MSEKQQIAAEETANVIDLLYACLENASQECSANTSRSTAKRKGESLVGPEPQCMRLEDDEVLGAHQADQAGYEELPCAATNGMTAVAGNCYREAERKIEREDRE